MTVTTFQELYERLAKASVKDELYEELSGMRPEEYDPHQLGCLLNPENHAPVIRVGDCACSESDRAACAGKCLFDALYRDEKGNVVVNGDLCVGCSECVKSCGAKKLVESRDVLPALYAVHHSGEPVYAMIAPAFCQPVQRSGHAGTPAVRVQAARLHGHGGGGFVRGSSYAAGSA